MKKYLSNIFIAIILSMFVCLPAVTVANAADQGKDKNAAETGYLENVILEKLPGKERISLIVSRPPLVSAESQTDVRLLIKLADTFVPENLRRAFGEKELNNISRVTPVQQSIDGRQWAYLTIDIKEAVPYAIKQEGKSIYIDFNVSVLPEKKAATVPAAASPQITQVTTNKNEAAPKHTGKIISLDFQDANIKSVLRLMAEYGNVSIVSSDDVKGNVTLTMKNVPWDQALDTILDINGLAKKQKDDVISVMTLKKKKEDESDRAKAEEDQQKGEDQRRARELKLSAEKGKLRQVLIEAKIVEATDLFVRDLGIQWGFHNSQSVGSYGLGVSGGSNTLSSNALKLPYPPEIPWVQAGTTNSLNMAAINFPAAAVSPTLGIVFGGARGFIETQLSALEKNGMGKIISSPKVMTMDGVKATIKQGEEVPYVTPASGNSAATVSFKEAVLKLEVKPQITEEGKISMEIKATNDVPDYARGQTLPGGNPPIRKNEVESKIVVKDGDTLVIGGVSKTEENETTTGIPWFYKIPVLGWLFKSENVLKQKLQLLIFITPKIIGEAGLPGGVEKTKE